MTNKIISYKLEQFESHEWHITGVKSTGVHSPTHIVQMESSIDLRMTDSYGKEIVQSVLVVGDLLQSSLICNIDSLEPTRIIRSTSNIQTRCLGISNTHVLVGDMLGTVHQMKFNEKQLKHEATFNVREGIIANIVKASPNKKWNPVVSAQYGDIVNFQFYFTTFSGGLFFHATIKEDYSDTLKRLQNNLSYLIPFVQTNDFTNESRRHYYDYYRSVSISRSPQGINIVDGELLQEYLKLSLEGRLTCLRGQFNGGLSIKTSDNDISQMLRALRDLT